MPTRTTFRLVLLSVALAIVAAVSSCGGPSNCGGGCGGALVCDPVSDMCVASNLGGSGGSGGSSSMGGGTATGGGVGGGAMGGGVGGGAMGGGSGGGASCGADTWNNYAQAFFASTCESCHTHNHAGQFSSPGSVGGTTGSPYLRISIGNMPPGGLSTTEKNRIKAWFACGKP